MLFSIFQDLTNQHLCQATSYLGEAAWEVKAIAVIACISDPEVNQ